MVYMHIVLFAIVNLRKYNKLETGKLDAKILRGSMLTKFIHGSSKTVSAKIYKNTIIRLQ